jgi:hypothetical protein
MDNAIVFAFVNYHFGPEHEDTLVRELFWKQVERLRPLSYIADDQSGTRFVTSDGDLFKKVCEALLQMSQHRITNWQS